MLYCLAVFGWWCSTSQQKETIHSLSQLELKSETNNFGNTVRRCVCFRHLVSTQIIWTRRNAVRRFQQVVYGRSKDINEGPWSGCVLGVRRNFTSWIWWILGRLSWLCCICTPPRDQGSFCSYFLHPMNSGWAITKQHHMISRLEVKHLLHHQPCVDPSDLLIEVIWIIF